MYVKGPPDVPGHIRTPPTDALINLFPAPAFNLPPHRAGSAWETPPRYLRIPLSLPIKSPEGDQTTLRDLPRCLCEYQLCPKMRIEAEFPRQEHHQSARVYNPLEARRATH